MGVEFCLNDLHKFLDEFLVENGQLVRGKKNFHGSSGIWWRRILERSNLLRWLRYKSSIVRKIADMQISRGYSFEFRYGFSNAWRDAPWEEIEKPMAEMVNLGREHHFAVFLPVFPIAAQYQADYLARGRSYVLKPQRKLKEICARLRIPYYDLYPTMDRSMLEKDGVHLTKESRQAVGRTLAQFLDEQGLLPRGISSKGRYSPQGEVRKIKSDGGHR